MNSIILRILIMLPVSWKMGFFRTIQSRNWASAIFPWQVRMCRKEELRKLFQEVANFTIM